jgi:hypothetical protein
VTEEEAAPDPLAERMQLLTWLIAHAWSDETFKQQLLANPKAALEKELGARLPEALEVKVLVDTPYVVHLVLPRNPAGEGELADHELDVVVGGSGAA